MQEHDEWGILIRRQYGSVTNLDRHCHMAMQNPSRYPMKDPDFKIAFERRLGMAPALGFAVDVIGGGESIPKWSPLRKMVAGLTTKEKGMVECGSDSDELDDDEEEDGDEGDEDDYDELMSQGIKPWDAEAGAALRAMRGDY